MAAILPFLSFLIEHLDLVNALYEAILGGATKEDMLKAIRDGQIAVADAAVLADLGPRPAP
jgi:hypothetical protein